jgi:predicted Ser/Thr protein kinase
MVEPPEKPFVTETSSAADEQPTQLAGEPGAGVSDPSGQSTTGVAATLPPPHAEGLSLTATITGMESPPRVLPTRLPTTLGERYQLRERLGEGGMGCVYRAFDQVLQREVALKLMRDPDSAASSHLLREARAQSRVTHDNVCRVYDAGDVDGRTFVSMQLIQGPSLRQAATSLPIAEKLEVIAQAAEGVHAAHRLGLVHRDLKPGNIMLEPRAGGGWRAFVVDFGLVRDLDAATSVTHGMAGTPQYMAPEQVRGQVERIDWRTDVWGLGATLFELLVGKPLFPAASPAEALVKVLQEDVRFPTAPRLPRDLRAILERCLDREPESRYGSARELAEDLRRYLAGEPVLARPIGPVARATRLARRHPRTTVATAAAVACLLGLSVLWGATALRARRQAELARHFGEEAAEIEAVTRYSALLPAHDARRERVMVRTRMETIEEQTKALGELAMGPGAYAVGRGWLALGELERARSDLDRAWAAGYREADVACALGQALAGLYRRGLYEARGITSREMRRSREQQLAAELREPALARLRDGVSATNASPALVEAHIALVEERWDEAVSHARAAVGEAPWLYEAVRLEGEIWLARAQAQHGRGEASGCEDSMRHAEAALARAIDLARSDPEARAAECQRRLLLLKAASKSGTSPEGFITPLREASEAALGIDPDAIGAQCDLASGYIGIGEWLLAHGQDPTNALGEAVRHAEEAIACDPEKPQAHNTLGLAAWRLASHERKSGRDPRPWSARALESFETATILDPVSALPRGNRGLVLSDLAQDERTAGRDPLAMLAEAVRAYDEALIIDPGLASTAFNRGVAALRAGDWQTLHGLDPRRNFHSAITDYRTAMALNPTLAAVPNALGAVHRSLATYLDATGGDPVPEWREAERWYERAIALRPDDANPHYNLALLLRTMADRAMERGEDPMPALHRARREAAATLEIDARDNRSHLQVANVELLIARALLGKDPGPDASLALAEQAIERSRAMNPRDGVVWITKTRLHHLRAQHQLSRGKPWEKELGLGLAAIDEAQRLIPSSGQTRQIRAELLLERARASTGAARERAARKAIAAIDDALVQNPNLAKELADLRKQVEALLPARSGA